MQGSFRAVAGTHGSFYVKDIGENQKEDHSNEHHAVVDPSKTAMNATGNPDKDSDDDNPMGSMAPPLLTRDLLQRAARLAMVQAKKDGNDEREMLGTMTDVATKACT